MRINSRFKDYYDVGMGLGQDQTLIYNRYKKRIDSEELTILNNDEYKRPMHFTYVGYKENEGHTSWSSRPIGLHFECFGIGFCGKFYIGMMVNIGESYNTWNKKDRENRAICYSIEDLDTYIRNHFDKEDFEAYQTLWYEGKSKWPRKQRRFDMEQFFNNNGTESYMKVFEHYNCPIFAVYNEGDYFAKKEQVFELNACLKDFDFIKKFDPYSAYQEISMFFGNMAEPRKDIPQLSNDDMIEAKGFDLKSSFRKEPTKKKK